MGNQAIGFAQYLCFPGDAAGFTPVEFEGGQKTDVFQVSDFVASFARPEN